MSKQKYKDTNTELHRAISRRSANAKYRRRKIAAMNVLSNGEYPRCSCCGCCIQEFLTIDHLNNDGKQHREMLGVGRGGGGSTIKLYNWILDATEEELVAASLRILCANCHMAFTRNGKCPHEVNYASN